MSHIERMIDSTFVKGGNKERLLSDFMSTYKAAFRALCIKEEMLPIAKKAKGLFPSSPTKLAVVRNFPYGTSNKAYPINDRIINEYDVVIPHKLITRNETKKVEAFLDAYYKTGRTIKWIIEESLYSEFEIYEIVKFIHSHYMKNNYYNRVYIKSNSGFVKRKRSLAQVIKIFPNIVRRVVPKEHFGVKISGWVSTLEEAKRIVQQDCIIGSSKGLNIFEEQQEARYVNAEKRIIEG